MRLMSATALAVVLTVAACGRNDSEYGAENAAEAESAATQSAAFDPAANLTASEAWLEENSAKEGVQVTPSGLQYKVLQSGPADGDTPDPGQYVCVHYEGTLVDGTVFDSSYERGEPAAFPSDRLIRGWVEALQMMRPGDMWELYIHPDLAYRDESRGEHIKPNDALVFTIELIGLLEGPPLPGVDCSES